MSIRVSFIKAMEQLKEDTRSFRDGGPFRGPLARRLMAKPAPRPAPKSSLPSGVDPKKVTYHKNHGDMVITTHTLDKPPEGPMFKIK